MTVQNLPIHLTRFIGREPELAELAGLLSRSRLVTLTGAGGFGKTRLAIEVARRAVEEFVQGVVWVDLTPLSEEGLVPQAVMIALDIHEQPGQELESSLIDFLKDKHLLLVLDNCEHLIIACARLVDSLLRACPGLSVLATSLEPLGVPGESSWLVPPLSVPKLAPTSSVGLQQYEAVTLFLDRARSVSPKFEITDDNLAAISHICRSLDGMPLAIELAASRVSILTPQQIADRLDDRFALLKSDMRIIAHPRHHTLRATIDWSFNSLSEKEQSLLCWLAVFESGCTLDAAEAICSDESVPAEQVLELLASLVAKSLIFSDTTSRSQAHYRMLESIHAFALEKLTASGEEHRLRDRHLDHYASVVEQATPNLVGTYQKLWFTWLVSEQNDIRAALRWSLASGRILPGLRIIIALSRSTYWAELRYIREWQKWLKQLLDQAPEDLPPKMQLEALITATSFSWYLGQDSLAVQHGTQAIALAEEFGDSQLLASALGSLARAYAVGGDLATANQLNQRVGQIYLAEEDWLGAGYNNLALALDAISSGQFDQARESVNECQEMAQISGDALLEAHAHNILGELEFCQNRYRQALKAYQISLPVLQQTNSERDAAAVILRLGYCRLELGEAGRARQAFQETLDLQQKMGNQHGMSECLTGFGALAVHLKSPELGVKLISAFIALTGAPGVFVYPSVRGVQTRFLGLAREQLTEATFIAAQQMGSNLSLGQALALADQFLSQMSSELTTPTGELDRLTPRQREVAGLIARGFSNPQIAGQLVLSKRTVEKHVANIMAALELQNRAELIRWAIDHRLMDSSSE